MKHTTPALCLFSALIIILIASGPGIFAQTENSKTPGEWTILESYDIPGKASGLAWDGTHLYFGIYGSNGDQVIKFDPETATYELVFINPDINDSYGMTYDGNHLWITDHGLSGAVPAYALELDFSGNALSTFDLPDHYMSGIAYDNGNFWVCTYYPDPGMVYKVDSSGGILSQFVPPGDQPWDICLEGEDLWITDYYVGMLHKTDTAGNVLESHFTENTKPAGVVFDGIYLWYVDGPASLASTLYKVDIYGIGTPAIEVPVTTYNFGNITVGDSAIWDCQIANSGTTALEISNIQIQNAVPIFINEGFPIVIEEGQTHTVSFSYKPTETGSLSTIATINSSDPITPEVELLMTGEALFDGPQIMLATTQHNYGSTRLNAHSRWFMEIQNKGNSILEISAINLGSDAYYCDPSTSFPLEIGILETTSVGLWFNPDGFETFEDTAAVLSNDLNQPSIEVTLSGYCEDLSYPLGSLFWNYTINTGWDNSIKAIAPLKDISGDGIRDVVVSSEDDFIRCFNGNASGSGDILWELEAGSVYGQHGLTTLEDINGDGYDEVVAGLAWATRAIKVLSGKTGEQLWIYDTHEYGDGGWVYQVWTGLDYNEDGTSDVLAATGNDGNNTGPKRIFCLDGINGDVIWDTNTDGPNFGCMGTTDFTGDGLPDVLGGSSNNNESEGKVYGIDGSDGSVVWTYTANGTSVWALEQLDDINGDGIKDVIAGDFGGHYYLLDAADGSLEYSGIAASSIFLHLERLDDVNGDGYADITIASSSSKAFAVDGYNGSPLWFTPLVDKCWNIDKIPDISGDGVSDLLAGTLFSNNKCYFLDGSSGAVLHSMDFNEPVDAIAAIPDINGDGSWEMVAGGRNGKLMCFSSGEAPWALLADFTADVTAGQSPLSVQFTDLSTGSATEWEWDFENDGIIDDYSQNPTFIYTLSGLYSVNLTISNGIFTNSLLKEAYIQVDTLVYMAEKETFLKLIASPNPFQNGTEIILFSDTEKVAKIEIIDGSGNTIKILKPTTESANKQSFKWDSTNQKGMQVPPGLYFVRAAVGNTYLSLKLLLR